MDDIKRGLVMIVVPVAVFLLALLLGSSDAQVVKGLGALLYISVSFVGSFSILIGIIYILIGAFSSLKRRFTAWKPDA